MDGRTIFARRSNRQLIFLCDRCGKIHRHGDGDGSRTSHCEVSDLWDFGSPLRNYVLRASDRVPGKIDGDEAAAIHRLAQIAYLISSEARKYLEEADVDPASEVFRSFEQAEIGLREVASLSAYQTNPIERVIAEAPSPEYPEDEE